ncbi:high affinity nitrate transporter [Dunaliella salina]|uniref:High affinity nitrate transporter n=3 Tax=Dunaliella salina TaxID=3046 RepID=A0ABQ7FX10_DUNSA|nr:high affinity nitrate transporter [Dunaliella salina]|eukprot:KAF5826896.1 high affinity nitrate transporter [Dunaliella salina]
MVESLEARGYGVGMPGYDREKWGFDLDGENKAKGLILWKLQSPHVRAFHLSWTSFFTSFVAAFAMAALLPVVRQNLDLTAADIGASGIANVVGAIGARVIIGAICDTVGPRYGVAGVLLLIAPSVFCASLIVDRGGIIAVRFFMGIGICIFVCNQFWSGTMFSPNCVGTVNATCGGWGNLGGGVTQLIMPLIYSGIKQSGRPGFTAWRWSFMVPGAMFLLLAMMTLLFAQDTPNGSYRDLRKTRAAQIDGKKTLLAALKNYRTWVLTLNYGYCFGVELTINSIIVSYFFDQFGLTLEIAGIVGAVFGLMNLFCRSAGGLASDLGGKYFGMRGRLWAYFILQLCAGALSIVLGNVDDTLGGTIAVMIVFSAFVQSAEGACYGVVPFVSRRSYGVVAGMVGAGGNTGSAVTQALFFADNPGLKMSTQDGLVWMGVMIMAVTCTLCSLHWPAWGGMLTPANPSATEEDYYLSDWDPEEVAANLHIPSLRFAMESKSMRGKANYAKYMAENSVKEGSEDSDVVIAKDIKTDSQ